MAADDAVAELVRKDGSTVQVGDRVSSGGYFGTVKFIGTIPPTKGVWLGVDWDDPSRGKHDGCHEGVRYFHTSQSTSGSFVRPKKVDLGEDCLRAIVCRYGLQQIGDAGVSTHDLFVLDADNRATRVEMVGAQKINQKQSDFSQLREVSVRDQCVYGVNDDHAVGSACPNITELDLSSNLLASWSAVARICRQLPLLDNLHVSDNRLSYDDDDDVLSMSQAFSNVTILYLNRMALDWPQVTQCAAMFPRLEHLYLCENVINTMAPLHPPCLQHLTNITLETNNISSWDHVLHLGTLQQLQVLVVTDNPIERLFFPDVSHGNKSHLFPSLKTLYFTGSNLKELGSFDELNKLAVLEELQFGQTPQLGSQELVREIAIAKVAGVTRVNRTLVEVQERRGAEIDYLKLYGRDWLKWGGHQDSGKNSPSDAFLALHPRFMHLVEKWGAPEDSEMKEQTKSLKDSLITLKIFCQQNPEKGTLEKKLPGTMSVQKLRTLIQRLFRLDEEFTLCYVSTKMQGPEIELDNDLRQLSFYSVESGDIIQVK